MSEIAHLARHWINQTAKGKGLRLSAADVELLNAIGVGELLTAVTAKIQREQCHRKAQRSIQEVNIDSIGTGEETEASGRHTFRSSGTTVAHGVTEAAARARAMSGLPKTH